METFLAPLRQFSTGERAKALCKSSSSLPVCMFDSAQSSPELTTIKFCLTKACQMKCQAILKLQNAFMAAGGSLSSDAAGKTQADSGFMKGLDLFLY